MILVHSQTNATKHHNEWMPSIKCYHPQEEYDVSTKRDSLDCLVSFTDK